VHVACDTASWSQSHHVKPKDLVAVFDSDDVDAAIRVILDKGEIQPTAEEREAQRERPEAR
jgi:ribosome maturation protein Sdo1